MKILDLALITPINQNTSMREAIASLGSGCKVIDWIKERDDIGVEKLNELFFDTVLQFNPDIIFMQIQGGGIIHPRTIQRIKEFKKDCIIINWTGDVRQPLPEWYLEMGKVIDITLFTNEKDIEVLKENNIPADYLQVGFDDSVFFELCPTHDYQPIVFLGSNYGNFFPLSQERRDMVKLLKDKYGKYFEVYGGNWGTRFLNVKKEHECYRSCKIAINQNHYDLPRFSSDRIFRIMGSGAFCLSYHYDGIEKEFEVGKHLDTWRTFDELTDKIDYYLSNEEVRNKIAILGCKHVHNNCTWKHRMEQLKTILYDRGLLTKN